jgi:hypothetical protein
VVNGGKRTLTNGKQVVDPTLIHERGFFVRTALGSRKLVCTERQEFEVEGFAGALSDMMESAAGEGGGGGEGIAAGSYYGQPAIWDETAWVPLAPGDAMMLDRIQALGELLIDPGAGAHITAPHVYLDVGVAFGTATLALEGNSVAIGGDEIGFYGTPPQARPGVIAAGEGDATAATLDSLIAALVQIGLITDDRFP